MLLTLDELETVSGGQNTTTIKTPIGSVTSNRTDYAVCHSTAKQICDTRPANRTSFLGLDTGPSASKSAACMGKVLPTLCGTPK